ncbi:MAG: metal transporter, partial [Burkholderiales bacterium]
LPRGGAARDGVAVPWAAVVYPGGKAWAYVQTGTDEFARRAVETGAAVEGGWFNDKGLEPGEAVVVSGAQLLLSEELKYQIRNENED